VLKGSLESPSQHGQPVVVWMYSDINGRILIVIQNALLLKYFSRTISYFDTDVVHPNILTIVVLITRLFWREGQLISPRWSVSRYTNDYPQYELVTDQSLHEKLDDNGPSNRGYPTEQ